jgi:hypothetical protein
VSTKKTEQPAVDKPLTIVVTVLPPKRGGRYMFVSAAREGEMPLVLHGPFAERHSLLDQAYAAVMKREPQVVTLPADKMAKHRPSKFVNGKPRADDEEEPVVAEVDTARDGDQLVEGGETAEELPAIEGDDAAQLSDISDAGNTEALKQDDDTEVDDGTQD